MKLETLNASRSGLIRAYSFLRADLVFHRVFPDQKKKNKKEGGILYNFKWPNHFQPWSLPSISFRKLIPSSAASLPLLSILCHVFLGPISWCLDKDIKTIPKIICVSWDVVNFTEAKATTGNYFGRHCFHFSMPLKQPPPAESWLVLMGNTLWDRDRYFKDRLLLSSSVLYVIICPRSPPPPHPLLAHMHIRVK